MATLTERLAEAEEAYHKLMLGEAVVRFRDANGEEVSYGATSRSSLAAYIADLKRQLGIGSTGPMRVFF